MSSKYAYGIDFGTTNSTVTAVNTRGDIQRLEIDPLSFDKAVMRSVIYIDHNNNFKFGKEAVDKYLADIAEGRVAQRKRIFTGKYIKIAAPASSVSGFQPDITVPEIIEVEEGEGGRLIQALKTALAAQYIQDFHVFDNKFSVVDLISIYLAEIKNRSDKIIEENVTKVILGRPVNYVGNNNDLAIERMKEAAKKAGFKEIDFVYEPIGASYDYGIDVTESQNALMFDFGGGTLDITIMKFPEKKVLANTGIGLGGDYFNSEIFSEKLSKHFGSEAIYGDNQIAVPKSLYEQLKNWYSISLMKTETFEKFVDTISYKHSDPEALESLRSLVYNNLGFTIYENIENAKKNLSKSNIDQIKLKAKNIDIQQNITREDFEHIIKKDLKKIEDTIDEALDVAKLNIDQISNVATTGGSSLIPIVRDLINNKFGKEKVKSTDAFTSVSTGLALRAKEIYF